MPADINTRHVKQLAVMRGWLEGRRYYTAAQALEDMIRHEQGTRKDGKTPKADHQLSVAQLIATLEPHLMFPEETLAAAFLHDMLEDHGDVFPLDLVEARYGKVVAQAVWHLSKKTRGMTKSYEVYFGEMATDPIASLVKIADRAHNVQTMPGVFTAEKQKEYLAELDTWFFPMIKKARRNFPRQYPAYENIKILLRCQAGLLKGILE